MNKDIYDIDQALESGNYERLVDTHRKIACKYHTRIQDFENGMWGYSSQFGFNYEMIGEDDIHENLVSMKYKIEGYIEDGGDGENMTGKMLLSFPTENLTLCKTTGEQISIVCLISGNIFTSEDVSIIVEENDVFIRSLPNGAKEHYLVTDRGFVKGTTSGIPDHYETKVKKINLNEYEELFKTETEKPVKIFISHSSKDVKYVKRFVEFLEDMNVPEEGIFCSSLPEYGIPGGKKIFDFLREQFEKYELHMIFVLSENYYSSVACMNEMGAAWVGRNDYTTILLPGFPYASIQGVLDPREIATKIDDQTTINIRLSELRDKVLSEFKLNVIGEGKWERNRDNFVKDMLSTKVEKSVSFSGLAIDIIKSVAKSVAGNLIRTEDITGNVSYSTESKDLLYSSDKRKSLEWDEAIIELIKAECLVLAGTKGGKIYKITAKGYKLADKFAQD